MLVEVRNRYKAGDAASIEYEEQPGFDDPVEELAHGYTTLKLEFGGFWVGEGRRWPQFGHRPPWDYSALWLLDGSTGAVISEPVADADPPGLYPSPNRPEALELWTGVVWSGNYRPLAATGPAER